MKSNHYWEQRAARRMASYLEAVRREAGPLARAYQNTSDYLTEEAAKVFRNFALSNHLSEAEAKRLLNSLPDDTTRRTLKKLLGTISDPKAKEELKAAIESPAYAWRIQRMEALRKDIGAQMGALYNVATTKTTSILQSTAKEAYTKTMFDIQKGVGYGFSFARMPVSRANEILKQPWSGAHYSKRLWSNTEKLTGKLKEELLTGFLTGRSYQKTAAALTEAMASGSMDAKRLVYTEANYVANQAELDSYRECGVEKYRFCATLDGKTSPVCRELDGREFEEAKAVPGRNFPPMHPWCRSTTVAVLEEMDTSNLKRRAKDPETGKYHLIPYDMSYEEWKQGNKAESDLGEKLGRAMKGRQLKKTSVSFSGLPAEYQKQFRQGLTACHPAAKNLLEKELPKARIVLTDGKSSFVDPHSRVITLNAEAPPSTLAHELFHQIDFQYKISENNDFDTLLRKDYNGLMAKSGGDILRYLTRRYPQAFQYNFVGDAKLKKAYRSVSDVFSGLSEDIISFGFGHPANYWKRKDNPLPREAWAQWGRTLYTNNPDSLKMFQDCFPEFTREALKELERLV